MIHLGFNRMRQTRCKVGQTDLAAQCNLTECYQEIPLREKERFPSPSLFLKATGGSVVGT